MQTLERPSTSTEPGSPRRGPGRGVALGVAAGVLALPVLVLLVASKWGVLLAVVIAALAALATWVWRRGLLFIEVVAFLIHFDGLGMGPIRMGRVVAVVIAFVLVRKLIVERWRPPAVPTRHWLPVMLLTVYGVLSAAWVDKVSGWFYAMGLLGIALVFYCVTALMVDGHEQVMKYLRAFWVGGLFGSALGVLALFLGTRSVGFGGDPNFFGLLQATMIPLTVYYRRNETDQLKRHLYTFTVLFVFAGAAGAGSRSGLIGASVAIVGTMITKPGLSVSQRSRTAVGAVIVAALAFGVGFVANPNNLMRGFSDRGAGRIDMWTGTVRLVEERPLLGHGFGQIKYKILPSLTTSPGVLQLIDTREDVSSHNTFLDILGDLGVVGLILWLVIFVVAILGFLRPRWAHTRQVSTTMFVMILPVISSSMFLPLLNNKVAWSLIGLSSSLQVPSARTRWRGFLRSNVAAGALPAGADAESGASTEVALAEPGSGDRVQDGAGTANVESGPATSASGTSADDTLPTWSPVALARWDVKVSRRFRWLVAAGALIGLVVFTMAASTLPTRYSATADVFLMDIKASQGTDSITVESNKNQVIDSLVTSGAYAQELKRLSGIDLTVPEVRERVVAERDGFGSFMIVSFTDADREMVDQVSPYLIPALDSVVASSRDVSRAQLQDELRPMYPGESRWDNSPLYLPVSNTPMVEELAPKRIWISIVGMVFGALAALTFVLLPQRHPRVNNDDDLPAHIGMGTWTHVGRAGRRYGATPDQYAQVLTMARENAGVDEGPRRILITTPRRDRSARALAAGVAASIAAEGRRAVLVDAQLDMPLLTARLGGLGRPGLVQAIEGAPIEPMLRKVHRWTLPSSVRRTLGNSANHLRFLPIGRRGRNRGVLRPDVLERFGPDVTLVILASPLTSTVPAGPLLAWSDAIVLTLVEGRTVTFDAEDAAAPIRSFGGGPAGAVMMDV